MSNSRDDQLPVDEFAAEDDLSIEYLTEDDPWAAFAAEPAATHPDRQTALAVDTEQPLRLTLVPPAEPPMSAPGGEVLPSLARSVWRPASVGLTIATVLIIAAAGAYLFLPEPEGLNEQIAAVIDNPPVPTAGADANGRSVHATEVLVPAAAENVTEPAPPVRVNDPRRVTRTRTSPVAARQPKASLPPPASQPSSEINPRAAAPPSSRPDTNPVTVVDDSDNSAPLSGDWVMNTRVESSQLQRYEGLRLGYVVNLRQDGDRISGTGWKVREDDRTINASSRTPINFDGVMNGDRVELTFTEGGRLRTTAGKLVLARDSDDVLRGRFFSTAAQSVGIVEIRR